MFTRRSQESILDDRENASIHCLSRWRCNWNAAYSLGKIFYPGNPMAIAALEKLIISLRHESLRPLAAYSLGKVAQRNPVAIEALIKIIESTKKDLIRRKAAYSLGKIDPGNAIALSTIEQIIPSTTNHSLLLQADKNLDLLRGEIWGDTAIQSTG